MEDECPVTHPKDFERMKELVGVSEGTADMGKGIETLKVTYELTSAGNAILESSQLDSPKDSITQTWSLCDKGKKKSDVMVKLVAPHPNEAHPAQGILE